MENSLWKRLRTCRKTDYRMKRLRTCRKTDYRMKMLRTCRKTDYRMKRLRTCLKTDYRMKRLRTCLKTDYGNEWVSVAEYAVSILSREGWPSRSDIELGSDFERRHVGVGWLQFVEGGYLWDFYRTRTRISKWAFRFETNWMSVHRFTQCLRLALREDFIC